MKIKGIWLFGLSGSGKTYLSKKIAKQIKNSFLIDQTLTQTKRYLTLVFLEILLKLTQLILIDQIKILLKIL